MIILIFINNYKYQQSLLIFKQEYIEVPKLLEDFYTKSYKELLRDSNGRRLCYQLIQDL
jgi:hypothetical protein